LEDKEKKDIFDRIWNFLASVKLAVFVLITLALSSIIGTIVEQRAEPATNIKLLSKFFSDDTAPTVFNIFVKLGFMDMYHSWWFVSLLVLFSINLIVCSLERFPKTLRLVKSPLKPLSENAIKTLPVKKEVRVKTNLKTARDEVFNSLTAAKYNVSEATEENAVQLYSQKGRYTRLGVYIVHLSILLIFIGAIIGARFGFRGFLNLPEGDTSSVAYASGGKVFPLGFAVKCNWYNTKYYSEIDMPQEFQSELVIIDGGREVVKKTIEVNDPLTYKGITFYQSSYGMVPNAIGDFILRVAPAGGQEKELRLGTGESFEISGTNIKGTIVNFSPALTRDRNTGALTSYSENMVNPAVAIELDEPGKDKYVAWFLNRYPERGYLEDGSYIKFQDYWGVEYTGLQVAKDPGVGIIYFACIIMTLGLYAAFFMSHKKLWVRLTSEKGFVRIAIGGSASKNRLSLERDIEKMLSKASQAIEERHPEKK